MKKLITILLFLLLTALSCTNVLAKETYTIEHLEAIYDVQENGEFLVQQTYYVNFQEPSQGITIDIPTKHYIEMEVDGVLVTKVHTHTLKDIEVSNNVHYKMENYEDGKRIILGDSSKLVESIQAYHISYTIKTVEPGIGGRHRFEQTLVPETLDATIKSATFQITMPYAFDLSSLTFYVGDSNTQLGNTIPGFSYNIQNTTITANILQPLHKQTNVYIDIPLSYDYFDYPTPFNWTWFILIACVLGSIATIVVYFLYGKDGLVTKSKEVHIPEELTCAAVGYIIDGHTSKEEVVALLIQWANQGYIQICEIEQRGPSICKLKEMSEDRRPYERNFFYALFKDRDNIYLDQVEDHFYQHIDQVCKDVTKYYSTKEDLVFYKSSLRFQVLTLFLSILPMLVGSIFTLYYYRLYQIQLALLGGFLLCLPGMIGIIILYYAIIARYALSRKTYHKRLIISGVLLLIMAVIYRFLYITLSGNIMIYYATLITTVILVWSALFMDKRTPKGNELLGKILGFKEFIETASKSELEELTLQDPQYFYKVLPYADILGVRDIWAKKFMDIHVEHAAWYVSNKELPVHLFMPRYYRGMSMLLDALYRPTNSK
ncbi:MAG: DUF2207 domain-containing protein [Erysipelotrichales bacterium]|nr:DUF2207 domain-containing protein [Erysipelotrichales bacterium]